MYKVCKFTNAGFEQISKYIKDEGSGFYQRKELTNTKRQKDRINPVLMAGFRVTGMSF